MKTLQKHLHKNKKLWKQLLIHFNFGRIKSAPLYLTFCYCTCKIKSVQFTLNRTNYKKTHLETKSVHCRFSFLFFFFFFWSGSHTILLSKTKSWPRSGKNLSSSELPLLRHLLSVFSLSKLLGFLMCRSQLPNLLWFPPFFCNIS